MARPKPALLQRLFPTLGRRGLGCAFRNTYLMARDQAAADHLDARSAALWAGLAGAGIGTLEQWFVRNYARELDWGLERHWDRVGVDGVVTFSYTNGAIHARKVPPVGVVRMRCRARLRDARRNSRPVDRVGREGGGPHETEIMVRKVGDDWRRESDACTL